MSTLTYSKESWLTSSWFNQRWTPPLFSRSRTKKPEKARKREEKRVRKKRRKFAPLSAWPHWKPGSRAKSRSAEVEKQGSWVRCVLIINTTFHSLVHNRYRLISSPHRGTVTLSYTTRVIWGPFHQVKSSVLSSMLTSRTNTHKHSNTPCCISMSMSMLHVHVHVHAACPCPCCMSMSMLLSQYIIQVRVHAVCPWQCLKGHWHEKFCLWFFSFEHVS